MNQSNTFDHKVVPQDEWHRVHGEFLVREKELTRLSDEIARQRRELPWVRVDKNYDFIGSHGPLSFADLFN